MKRITLNQFLLGVAVVILGTYLLIPARAQEDNRDPVPIEIQAQPLRFVGGGRIGGF